MAHGFDYGNIRKAYQDRYGNTLIKEKIECLFWKESLITSNLIKQNNIDLREIFDQNNKLKFLMPIRNPLDCAESNMRTGHMLIFPNLNNTSSFEEVLESIFKEFLWFFNWQRQYPERFFYFCENSFDQNQLSGLASFLRVYPDNKWIKTALSKFQIKKKYKHDLKRITYYKALLERYFLDYPEVIERLSAFV